MEVPPFDVCDMCDSVKDSLINRSETVSVAHVAVADMG